MQLRAYLRVSTDEQAEEGFSLPTQRQRVTDFCRSQWGPAAEVAWYIDDGYSAKDTDRPRLASLRKNCRPGDVVIVLRLDRLTRSVLDLYTLLKEWDESGIYFRSVTEPYDTQKPEGRFMIGLLALLAEWERLRISERVREVMANTVRSDRRHLSKPPMGYDLAEGRLAVNPAEAALVREIFALYCRGLGTRAIALELNRRGARTKQRAEWSDFTVAYVLRNPVYTGKVAWQRLRSRGRRTGGRRESPDAIIVEGAHPALVTPELWQAAQDLLASRAKLSPRTASNAHPLTGLLRCGLCGAPVHGVLQRRYRDGEALPGRERRYYRCSRRDHRKECALPYLPAPELEQRVLAALTPPAPIRQLHEIAAALSKPASPDQQQEHAAALRAELRRCERALRRWDEAYAAEDITREEWLERRSPVKQRQADLQEALAGLPPEAHGTGPAPDPAALAGAMARLPLIWAALSPPEQKVLLHGLLGEVTAHPDGSVAVRHKCWP